jgi:hypothetical protein
MNKSFYARTLIFGVAGLTACVLAFLLMLHWIISGNTDVKVITVAVKTNDVIRGIVGEISALQYVQSGAGVEWSTEHGKSGRSRFKITGTKVNAVISVEWKQVGSAIVIQRVSVVRYF